MKKKQDRFLIRNTQDGDDDGIIAVCRGVYSDSPPWSPVQLQSHRRIFPEGQWVVIDRPLNKIIGYAASLIVLWDDYGMTTSWRDFTDAGMFTNHDPANGRTLYGAEIMIDPAYQGSGLGKRLYAEREKLVREKKLLRIRAGARLRGYHKHSEQMSAEQYVKQVVDGQLRDPTLTFQIKQGFHVLAVAANYLKYDPESLGYAAVIEWINDEVAQPPDYEPLRQSPFYRQQPRRF